MNELVCLTPRIDVAFLPSAAAFSVTPFGLAARRSMRTSAGKNNEVATSSAPSKGAAKPTQHAPRRAAGLAKTADVSENPTTKRPERRVRRLRSLPGSAPR